jgi:hypothetical protein
LRLAIFFFRRRAIRASQFWRLGESLLTYRVIRVQSHNQTRGAFYLGVRAEMKYGRNNQTFTIENVTFVDFGTQPKEGGIDELQELAVRGERLIAELAATIAVSKALRDKIASGTTPGDVLVFGRAVDRVRKSSTEDWSPILRRAQETF